MELTKEERLRELKEDAKWGSNEDIQKQAILELGRMGPDSFEALKEVISVTSHEDIREACHRVINGAASTGIGESEKNLQGKKEEKSKEEKVGSA